MPQISRIQWKHCTSKSQGSLNLNEKRQLTQTNTETGVFWTVVLEKTLESPLDCKEIQPVNPKRNQFQIFIARTDAEAETPILWPPDAKNWLTGKDPEAGKDWRQEKGMTEDEMVGWHHRLNGHEIEQAPEVGDGQGGLVCYSPWGCKESEVTEQLNWTELDPETTQTLELSNRNFKEAIIKMLQQQLRTHLKERKGRKSWQINRRYKVEPDGNFGTEKAKTKGRNTIDGLKRGKNQWTWRWNRKN